MTVFGPFKEIIRIWREGPYHATVQAVMNWVKPNKNINKLHIFIPIDTKEMVGHCGQFSLHAKYFFKQFHYTGKQPLSSLTVEF